MNALKKNKIRRAQANPAPVRRPAFTRPRATSGRNRLKAERQTPRNKYVLRLFVAGATAHSRQAILRVRELCAAELQDNCALEVIDIYQQPALARANQIVATPTLIVEFPPPLRRFIGNLTNITGLFVELDLVKKVEITV
jgi:circadian clock protein KaiB